MENVRRYIDKPKTVLLESVIRAMVQRLAKEPLAYITGLVILFCMVPTLVIISKKGQEGKILKDA